MQASAHIAGGVNFIYLDWVVHVNKRTARLYDLCQATLYAYPYTAVWDAVCLRMRMEARTDLACCLLPAAHTIC